MCVYVRVRCKRGRGATLTATSDASVRFEAVVGLLFPLSARSALFLLASLLSALELAALSLVSKLLFWRSSDVDFVARSIDFSADS